jgi:hypothetical protein
LFLGVIFLLGAEVFSFGAQDSQEQGNRTIHVNSRHPSTSDENSGAEERPLASVAKATELAQRNNRNGIGTKVIIHPGTYRESIQLENHPKDTDASMIFEAKQKGTAIISGSDVWDGWQREGNTNVYSHAWPHRWGLQTNPWGQDKITLNPIVRRREMIFVDGKLLRQVLSMLELQTGSFYVDEEKATVYLSLTPETKIGGTVIEVATRSGLLKVDRKRDITFRGLIFQHDNSSFGDSAVGIKNSSRILMEDCKVQWNNWSALDFISSDNITARRNAVNSNGGAGITVWKVKTLLFEDNETSANNWRGAMGKFYGWAVAGVKSMRVHDGIYRRHRSVDNLTRGMWFDYDNVNIEVDNATLCSNFADGIDLEANEGPITIKNSTICRNQNGPGIIGGHTRKVRLDGNILYGNGRAQIRIVGGNLRPTDNWETKQRTMLQIGEWTLKDNIIVGKDSKQLLFELDSIGSMPFVKTLIQEGNLWYNSESTRVFKLLGKDAEFAEWQHLMGRDSKSSFADPRFVEGDNLKFDLLPNSPWKKKVPSQTQFDAVRSKK